jgi:peptidoglycan/LPS O-acetylase OafA/YrhL
MERSRSIDALRAVALFLVCFGRHLTPCPKNPSSYVQTLIHDFTMVLRQGGWVGVDLFFVLSGFLVAGLLFREHQKFGSISAKRFLVRRGFKIYPAFWLLITATVAFKYVQQHYFPTKAAVSELTFVQNYGPYLWSHTWSLAVEEHFYFLLLVFLLALSHHKSTQNKFASIPYFFLALAVLSLSARILTAHALPYGPKTHLFPSHLRMDSLFFGVLISYFYHFYPDLFLRFARRFKVPLASVGVLLLSPAFIFPLQSPFIYTWGLTLFYIGSGCLLVASVATNVPKNKFTASAAYIGSHSYSIYLWHLAVAFWIIPRVASCIGGHWSWPLYAASYFVLSLGVGVAMALLIEFPTLKMRDRFFPSLARPLSVAPIGPNHALQRTGSAVTARAPPPSPPAQAAPAPPVVEL